MILARLKVYITRSPLYAVLDSATPILYLVITSFSKTSKLWALQNERRYFNSPRAEIFIFHNASRPRRFVNTCTIFSALIKVCQSHCVNSGNFDLLFVDAINSVDKWRHTSDTCPPEKYVTWELSVSWRKYPGRDMPGWNWTLVIIKWLTASQNQPKYWYPHGRSAMSRKLVLWQNCNTEFCGCPCILWATHI